MSLITSLSVAASTAKAALSLMPILIDMVKLVEKAFPESGKGAQKLEMVRASLQAAYENINDATAKFEDVWPSLNALITIVVKLVTKA